MIKYYLVFAALALIFTGLIDLLKEGAQAKEISPGPCVSIEESRMNIRGN